MITEHRDAPLLQFLKQVGTVALAIEDYREARLQRIGFHPPLLFGAHRSVGLDPRNHILAQRLHQPVVDLLVDINERLPIHGVDPVIHARP